MGNARPERRFRRGAIGTRDDTETHGSTLSHERAREARHAARPGNAPGSLSRPRRAPASSPGAASGLDQASRRFTHEGAPGCSRNARRKPFRRFGVRAGLIESDFSQCERSCGPARIAGEGTAQADQRVLGAGRVPGQACPSPSAAAPRVKRSGTPRRSLSACAPQRPRAATPGARIVANPVRGRQWPVRVSEWRSAWLYQR